MLNVCLLRRPRLHCHVSRVTCQCPEHNSVTLCDTGTTRRPRDTADQAFTVEKVLDFILGYNAMGNSLIEEELFVRETGDRCGKVISYLCSSV